MTLMGQGNYATPYTFTTLAGMTGIHSTNDGTGSSARFASPFGVAVDTNGNVYVADTSNNTIRKVTPGGLVTTLAGLGRASGTNDGTGGTARFNGPSGVAVGSSGNVYVADSGNHTIRQVTPGGVVTTLAGLAGSPGGADGTNNTARFDEPFGMAVDTNDNIYVADEFNCAIRKVTPVGTNWVVTTLTGGPIRGSADGTNGAAQFSSPCGVAIDHAGNLYVADTFNHTIRQVTPTGTNWVVTTLAGLALNIGNNDGTGSSARFFYPHGVAVDSAGNVAVADDNNSTIRQVIPSGTNSMVTTLAGCATCPLIGIPDGTGNGARFGQPYGVAADSAGNLYVAETGGSIIRKGFLASSVPAPILQSPRLSASHIGFGITGLSNLAVEIESSVNLSNWQTVSTNVLTGGSNYFATNQLPGVQFYRAHVR